MTFLLIRRLKTLIYYIKLLLYTNKTFLPITHASEAYTTHNFPQNINPNFSSFPQITFFPQNTNPNFSNFPSTIKLRFLIQTLLLKMNFFFVFFLQIRLEATMELFGLEQGNIIVYQQLNARICDLWRQDFDEFLF